MSFLVGLAVSGAANGAIYALIGLSFNLVYRTTGALNFATGHLVMLGAFVATTLTYWVGGNVLLGGLLSVPIMGLFGALVARLIYIPLRSRHVLWFIVATLGLSIVVENAVVLIWGPEPRALNSLFSFDAVRIGQIVVSGSNIIVLLATIVVLIVISGLLFFTVLGIRCRATAQDESTARLVGINTANIATWIFAASTALAGYAGVLLAPLTLVTSDMGRSLILKGFIAVVIGGFGSLPGSVVGGIVLGFAEAVLAQLVSSQFKEVLLFVGLIVVLVVRPKGFFAEEAQQRA
jgi:branched-chain amino acid transport system permease protein